MGNEKIQRIINEFDHYNGTYKREAMEEAVALKDEITPYLIEHLEKLLSDPLAYRDGKHYACIYAFVLLGHFREAMAHELIMKIVALPNDILDDLFGDMKTEDFPWIFYATCNGSVERIKELVLNKKACDYCRGSAAQAIVYAAIDGAITREAAVDFFAGLFTGSEAGEDSDFWNLIASSIADLYPEELMDVIKKAYEDGLIWPGFIGYKDFERTLVAGKEQQVGRVRKGMRHNLDRDDVHSYMSWWACFKDKRPAGIPEYRADVSRKKAAKTKNNKKKMAKATRKKNRR